MDSDKVREAANRTKAFEKGTGDALVEGLGGTGLIALGVATLSKNVSDPYHLVGGLVLVALGVAFYAVRRHYRDQRFR